MTISIRQRLRDRREHELITFVHGKFRYHAGIGRFDDGTLAEVFLNVDKHGTELEVAGRDAAITVSIALQHGTPAEDIRRAVTRNANGTASGAIGALLDLLADK